MGTAMAYVVGGEEKADETHIPYSVIAGVS